MQHLSANAFGLEDTEQSIAARFEQQVAAGPERVAVIDGGVSYTYDALNRWVNRIAAALVERVGAEPTRVGIYLEKGFEYLAAIFGVLKAGHAYVPIDPAFPRERNLYILGHCQAAATLTNEAHAAAAAELGAELSTVIRLDTMGEAYPDANPALPISPDALAYIIYTSGSTGRPKGVTQNQRNALHGCMRRSNLQRVTPDDRMSLFYSCSVMGSVYCIFGALLNGAALLPYDFREEGLADLAGWLTRNKVTIYHSVASVFRQFAAHFDGAIEGSSVRLVIFGGERVLSSDIEAARRVFSPQVHFFTGLGSTETGTIRHLWIDPTTKLTSRVVPIGYPVEGVEIVLADDDGNPVDEGEIGEIQVHSRYLATGYWNDEETTRRVFSEVPGKPGVRCYRMGDLGQLQPGGLLAHRGRKDFQVKIRGFRVELGEVESALQSHPSVAEGLVNAQEIGDETQLVGYVVPAPGVARDALTVRELRDYLRGRLPSYMLPTVFVALAQMPRTPNGKLDRKALPPPLPGNELADEACVAPEGPTEQALVAIVAEVLRREQVGTNQNFFDIGGDSLRATQLVARVQDRFGVALSMRAIFEAPDIRRLAEAIDRSGPAGERSARDGLESEPGTTAPATPAQRRMWLIDRLYSGTAAYNISNAVRLEGPLDVPALERALNEMVARHETLRTVFPSRDGECQQVILPAAPAKLDVQDLRALPQVERLSAAKAVVDQHVGQAHDLARGPLFGCKLLVLDAQEHLLSLVFNHIVYDNIWSSRIFFDELGKLYAHYHEHGAQAASSPLSPMPFRFADFARWEARRIERGDFGAHIDYWREQLAAPPAALELASDRPRPAAPTFRGGQVEFVLPSHVRLALTQLCRGEGATVFMAMLAAWQLLLSRYSGQSDILVGIPTGRRYQTQTEEMIGLFINNLVMRARLSEEVTFRELLGQVRTTAIEAFSHDELPFEKLVELLRPSRTDGATPYFQHFFIHRNATNARWELPGLRVEPMRQHQGGAKFDLTLSVLEEEQRISGTLEYSADLFDEDTAERIAANYLRLLEDAIERPTVRVSELELVAEAERAWLMERAGPARTTYPAQLCTHQLFEQRAREHPQAVAVLSDDGELTYGALDERANALAAQLRELGVGPDTLVGVCLNRSPQLVVALLGVMKSGGAYVPLDPDFPPERIRYMVSDSAARVLVTEEALAAQFEGLQAALVVVGADGGRASTRVEGGASPRDLAYVIYTSGSTGKPKGVQVTHRSLTNFLWAMRDRPGLGRDDVVQSLTTVCFDIAALELYLPLTVGAKVVVSGRETSMSPTKLLDSLKRHSVTLMQATPVTWRMLLEHGFEAGPKIKVLCGGEAMGHKLAGQLAQTGCEVWNMYGPTETTVWSTVGKVERPQDASFVGTPIANTELYVTTPGSKLQPIGVPGELLIGGDGLARGYLGRDELTRERFVPNPWQPDARLYRTGDLVVRRRDGSIEFMGRIDNQVKVRGFRIELGEIEALLGAQPGVAQAVVTARPAESGDNELVAYVTSVSGELSQEPLRDAMRAALPAYMMPSYIVQLDALPLTPNGKVDRKALPAPSAELRTAPRQGATVQPRTPTEELLQRIWARILGVESPGIDDNFFDLGGHSIQAVRIVDAAAAAGLAISPLQFFQSPTIAGLAAAAEARAVEGVDSETLVTLRDGGEGAPLFLLHSTPGDIVGFAELSWALPPGRPLYGIQSLGLRDVARAHRTIVEMASYYADEIVRVFGRGRVHLAGWCFGGTVALELSRQLQARGARVGVVCLMETFPRVPRDPRYWLRRATLAARMGPRGGRVLAKELRARLVRERGEEVEDDDVHALSLESGPFKNRRAVYDINLRAVRSHLTTAYPGEITLIKSLYTRGGLRDRDFGWPKFAARVRVHELDTSHMQMLKSPTAERIAELLHAAMRANELGSPRAPGVGAGRADAVGQA